MGIHTSHSVWIKTVPAATTVTKYRGRKVSRSLSASLFQLNTPHEHWKLLILPPNTMELQMKQSLRGTALLLQRLFCKFLAFVKAYALGHILAYAVFSKHTTFPWVSSFLAGIVSSLQNVPKTHNISACTWPGTDCFQRCCWASSQMQLLELHSQTLPEKWDPPVLHRPSATSPQSQAQCPIRHSHTDCGNTICIFQQRLQHPKKQDKIKHSL